MLAEHERRLRHADVLGAHDFVGAAILQHAVLVNAGFVRERVAADDRLVRLDALRRSAPCSSWLDAIELRRVDAVS